MELSLLSSEATAQHWHPAHHWILADDDLGREASLDKVNNLLGLLDKMTHFADPQWAAYIACPDSAARRAYMENRPLLGGPLFGTSSPNSIAAEASFNRMAKQSGEPLLDREVLSSI